MKNYFDKPFVAWCIFMSIALVICIPIFKNINNWGVEDWDEYLFRNALARQTILQYHQFPLWNPYTCGGNVFLAHPTSSFLSPFFIFVILFKEVVGLKIEIFMYLVVGMFGMYLLARYFGLNGISSLLPSFVYMLSAIYPLHVTAGLIGEFSMAFVPYIFLFYLKSFKNFKYIFLAILFLSFMVLGGSLRVINIFILFLFIYSLCEAIKAKQLMPIRNIFFILLTTLLLCSIKTFPVMEFFAQHPRKIDIPQGVDLKTIAIMLFKKVLSYDPAVDPLPVINRLYEHYDWYHCGAYIGLIPFALAIIAAIYWFKYIWPLIVTSILFIAIAMGEQSPINIWKLVHMMPVFSSFHSSPRFIIIFVFAVALLSGLGLSKISALRNRTLSRLCIYAITIFIAADLITMNFNIVKDAFTQPAQNIKKSPLFYQDITTLDYMDSDSDVYPRFLSNVGTINAESVDDIYPTQRSVLPKSHPGYRGEVYLLNTFDKANIAYFSPNKIVVHVDSPKDDILILNQNYYQGWRTQVRGKNYNAQSYNGLIAIPINAGYENVTFYYLPASFIVGFFISWIMVLSVIFYLLFYKKSTRKVLEP